MKKKITLSLLLLATLSLAGCGLNNNQARENSSLKADNSSLRAKNEHKQQENKVISRFSTEEYALAAYLKFQHQSAANLANNSENMHWRQDGNKFSIDFGAHSTEMLVESKNVQITFDDIDGDHMGQGNGHKEYTKEELYQEIKSQKHTIDEVLSKHQNDGVDNSSSNSSQQDTQSSNAQSTSTSSSSDSDDDYNLPLSDPRNPDGEKQAKMMSIAGDPQYRDTPDGSVDSEGQSMMSSIRSTMHNQ